MGNSTGTKWMTREEKQLKFNKICENIEQGMPLRKACVGVMNKDLFYQLLDDPNNKEMYARANQIRQEEMFEDIADIADNEGTYVDSDGVVKVDNGAVQRDRLRIEARKWMLAKMAPKKYGDKIDVTTDGEKIESTVTIFQLPDNGRD